ncbi:helix-turn-helix transcriptional regulator [Kribbella ginsengisoli]|uniref:LuxR family transcriptional regulator n=1 Tax=Kribbella ginsengisoli TaxID=363865 RepID=A0ABP6X424_9ACTN
MSTGEVPVELTSFVGREEQIRAGLVRLEAANPLTLVGPGGVGKTRLAGRLAQAAQKADPRLRVHWCTLIGVPDGADAVTVERTVAKSLGVEIVTERSARSMLLDHLGEEAGSGPVLLVLDNCEHVAAPVGSLVSAILAEVPGVQVLATSREALGCAGEQLFAVPPLTCLSDAPEGSRYEALDLLTERAAAVGISIGPADHTTAALLCQRLDGLPLAIELAAAGLRSQSLREILARLDGGPGDERFSLLTRGPRHGAHPMHHSMQAAVDWSYRLCDDAEKSLWARLSVFENGWDLAAAQAVGAGPDLPAAQVLDVLTELVGKSVVTADTSGPSTRYRMLETLRQYGVARAEESGETESLRRRHRDHFLEVSRQAAVDWYGPREVEWLSRTSRDLANFRAALAWSSSIAGEEAAGLEIAVGLARLRLQFYLGNSGETIDWLRTGLAATKAAEAPELRLWAVVMTGLTALCQGDLSTAEAMVAQGRDEAGDDGLSVALMALLLGLHAFFALGDPASIAVLRAAATGFESAGAQYRGERAMALMFAGMAADWYGPASEAVELSQQYADETLADGAEWAHGWSLLVSGLALIWHVDALSLPPIKRARQQSGDHWGLMYLTHLVAWAAAEVIKQRPEPSADADHADAIRAARALGGASRLRERYRVAIATLPPFRDANAEAERVATGVLGDDGFRTAYRFGNALHYDEIDALATNEVVGSPDGHDNGCAAPTPWSDLTSAEKHVAQLAAQGLSDAQIARRRVCSVRTVEKHLENVRRKLLIESRTEISRWVPPELLNP